MTFNLELTGEQVHALRMALARQSNMAYQKGDDEKSRKLDAIDDSILDQIIRQKAARS